MHTRYGRRPSGHAHRPARGKPRKAAPPQGFHRSNTPAAPDIILRPDHLTPVHDARRLVFSTRPGVATPRKPGTLLASVTNPDAGDATDTVEMTYTGQPVEIGFNARYVLDLLAILPGSKIRIALGDSTSPALITATDHEGWQAVLMPMRV